jgi:hypothetical protein
MNFLTVLKNPLVLAFGKELLGELIKLVSSVFIPKVKRYAFEKMTEGIQEFGEFILDEKEKIEATETTLDDDAYAISKEAFRKFLDEGEILYSKM